jgi:hypothetical protein
VGVQAHDLVGRLPGDGDLREEVRKRRGAQEGGGQNWDFCLHTLGLYLLPHENAAEPYRKSEEIFRLSGGILKSLQLSKL